MTVVIVYAVLFPPSYEIHISSEARRKGLGKFLLQILELIGFRYSCKVMQFV